MMDLEKMKKRKKELGITNQELSERSGVPLGTVNKIFSGATKSPQYDTILALETVLGMTFYRDEDGPYVSSVHEEALEYSVHGRYTLEDYYALPDHVRAELIDGTFYYMSSPGLVHQKLIGELYFQFKEYIRRKAGPCEVFLSPFDVFLDSDDKTVVQPDLMIICDQTRVESKGVAGAPDFVMEIISQSTGKKDYSIKLNKYWSAGVREYWIVDPLKGRILTYCFNDGDMDMKIYGMHDTVPVGIYDDLSIDFGEFSFLV